MAHTVKSSVCNSGDLGLTPVLGRSPGEGKGYPFQYSGLENCRVFLKSLTSSFEISFFVVDIPLYRYCKFINSLCCFYP